MISHSHGFIEKEEKTSKNQFHSYYLFPSLFLFLFLTIKENPRMRREHIFVFNAKTKHNKQFYYR